MRVASHGTVAAVLLTGWPLVAQTVDSTRDSTAAARAPSAATSVTEWLLGRFPGVLVYPSSGTTGAGARVRIRGSSSILLPNEPLVYVDGIRVNAAEQGLTINVGGQQPSRLNDFNPDDIDSVEVVHGPAAGVEYGAEAAHGVLLIHTKRGGAGPARWHAYAEDGRVSEPTRWPANYGAVDRDNPAPTYQNGGCTLQDEAAGSCSQDFVRSFAPLEARSQFAARPRRQYGLQVSGGTATTRYGFGVERETDGGVYELSGAEVERLVGAYGVVREETLHPNILGRTSLRGRVELSAGDRTTLALSAFGVSSTLRLPFNDNHVYGLLGNGLRGSSDPTVNDGWRDPFRPGELFQVLSSQDVGRYVLGLRVTSRPLDFLTIDARAGVDRTDQEEFQLQRFGEGPAAGRQGAVSDNRVEGRTRTLRVVAEAAYAPGLTLRGTTRLGVLHFRRVADERIWHGFNFPSPEATTVEEAASQSLGERRLETNRLSIFVEQELSWRGGLTIVGGLRRDDDSRPPFVVVGGPGLQPAPPPDPPDIWQAALAVTWTSPRPLGGPFGALQLRAAHGGANTGILGAPPERLRETELRAHSVLSNGRGTVSLSAYDRRSAAVLAAPPPPSLGEPRPANRADVINRGVEFQLAARLVDGPTYGADVVITAWGNRNRVENVDGGVVPVAEWQRAYNGFPLGGYWRRAITRVDDANGDGIVQLSEITSSDSTFWSGTPFPTHGASVNTRIRLDRLVEVSALIDYRAGHHLLNRTAEWRCISWCREKYDRATSLERQAAAVGAIGGMSSSYVEDADFLKVRELAVTLVAPVAWASRVRARSLRLTIAGRNLATWTGYSGPDPEVNAFGQAGSGLATADFFTQPPVRIWTARLDVEF